MAYRYPSLRIPPVSRRQGNSTSSELSTTTSSATLGGSSSSGVGPTGNGQGSSTSTETLTTKSVKETTTTTETISTSTTARATSIIPVSATVISSSTTIRSTTSVTGPDSIPTTISSAAGSSALIDVPSTENVGITASSATSSVLVPPTPVGLGSPDARQDTSSVVSSGVSEPIASTPVGSTTSAPLPISTDPHDGVSDPPETASSIPSILTAITPSPTRDQTASQSSSAVHAPAPTTHVAAIVGICLAVLVVLGISTLCIFQWRKKRQAKTATRPYMTNRNSLGGESFRALRLSGESRSIPDMSIYPSPPPPTFDVRTSTGIYNFPVPPTTRAISDARATPENANLLSLLISYYDARSPSRNSDASQGESSLPSDIVDASAEPMDWSEPDILPRASSELMQRECLNESQTSLPSGCDLSMEKDVYCAI